MYIIHERLRRLKAVSGQSDFVHVSTPLHAVYNNPDIRHTLLYKGQYRKMSSHHFLFRVSYYPNNGQRHFVTMFFRY